MGSQRVKTESFWKASFRIGKIRAVMITIQPLRVRRKWTTSVKSGLGREIHFGGQLTFELAIGKSRIYKVSLCGVHKTKNNVTRARFLSPTIIYVTRGMNTENLVHSLLPYFSRALLINNAAGAEAASSRTGEVRSSPQSSDCTYIKRLLLLNSLPPLPDWEISHFPLGLLLVQLCKEE